MLNFISKLKSNGKYIANGIFLAISCLLVISLLTQLTDERYIQVIYVFLAVGLDLVRMWIVGLAKALWSINKGKSIALWLVYLVHASIIIIASIGFSLAAINTKAETVKAYNLQRSTIIDDVNLNQREITRLEADRAKLKENDWKFTQLSNRIDALQKIDRGLLVNLQDYQEVKVDINQNVFEVLGAAVGVKGIVVKLYVLFILSFLLELSLILTSWDIKINEGVSSCECETETETELEIDETQTETPETETKKPETQTETKRKMVKNGKKVCPICGKNFPFKHDDKVFCGAKCRLTAHRHKEAS
jgi:ribosomal protein S27AE